MEIKLQKTVLTVGTTKHTLVVARPIEEAKVEQKQFHHIHVLDRSGSMYGDIDALIDNVQSTITETDENDLISIIWFSSPGQYRTLVKGAKRSDNLLKLLDSLRSVIGTTCFSDPIKEIELIVGELHALCPNISVTFFTDGLPVVPWSIEEEKRKIFDSLSRLKEKIVAVNTIGYGYNYNQTLLRDMASTTEYGVFAHSSDIDSYKTIFVKNYEVLNGTVSDPINVISDGNEIIFLTAGFTKMVEKQLDMTRMAKADNAIFILGKGDFDITINGTTTNTTAIANVVPAADKDDFLYAYAYNLFYQGKRQKCLDIVAKNLKDKYLADKQMSVFTFDDAANYQKELEQALYNDGTNGKARFKEGKCSANYLPKNNAHCVMDVVLALAEAGAYYMPVHSEAEKYQRTRRAAVDSDNRFKRSDEPVFASFEDFVFAEDRMNMSIRFKINGKVHLNPKSAHRVGLDSEFDSFIWRSYTIIKDGALNVKKMVVAMPDASYKALEKAGTTMKQLPIDKPLVAALTAKSSGAARFVLALVDLSPLPIINRTYLVKNANMSKVFETCSEMIKDEALQKWIGHYIKEINKLQPSKEGVFQAYTDEQALVLEEHGVDKSGAYKGIQVSVASVNDSDPYEIRSLSFTFKGVSSLPSVNDVEKRLASGKEPTISQKIMIDAKNELSAKIMAAGQDLANLTLDLKAALEKEQKEVRARLRTNRYWLGGMKIAKMLTGDWFEDLTTSDDKGNYVYQGTDKTLLVKAETTVEYL
jgi:hypothetical protein